MTVRELFNAYVGNYESIKLYQYDADRNNIGADLEEDYIEIYNGKYRFMPEEYRNMKIEYFTVEEYNFIIYLEN